MSNGNKKHIFSAQMNLKRKLKEHKNLTASSKDQLKMCTTLNAHKQEEKVLHKCSVCKRTTISYFVLSIAKHRALQYARISNLKTLSFTSPLTFGSSDSKGGFASKSLSLAIVKLSFNR
jgi:hypothetical protein